ncbi:MAG: molecular chaperone TorD family protein [Bdellovibrionales bacterium]|nr:molecular chaperone TorD family protein [Bdellovibrionales bacterium]
MTKGDFSAQDWRRGAAFVLASVVASYPDDDFLDSIAELLEDPALPEGLGQAASRALSHLRERLAPLLVEPDRLDDIRSEYIDLFDRGQVANPLHETEYGRERSMVKGGELVDIAGFYRAFGLDVGAEGKPREMLDHVAVELEFYALLLLKSARLQESGDEEGRSIVEGARQKFLVEHLGRFVATICERPGVKGSAYYLAVFEFCRELVADEAQSMGWALEPVQWISGQEAPEVTCGGTLAGLAKP